MHEPWKLAQQPPGYPEPIVDHAEAVATSLRKRRHTRAHDVRRPGTAAPAGQGSRRRALRRAARRGALARPPRLSPAHFSREFRRVFGESPHQYLLTRRLERAAALLARPTARSRTSASRSACAASARSRPASAGPTGSRRRIPGGVPAGGGSGADTDLLAGGVRTSAPEHPSRRRTLRRVTGRFRPGIRPVGPPVRRPPPAEPPRAQPRGLAQDSTFREDAGAAQG